MDICKACLLPFTSPDGDICVKCSHDICEFDLCIRCVLRDPTDFVCDGGEHGDTALTMVTDCVKLGSSDKLEGKEMYNRPLFGQDNIDIFLTVYQLAYQAASF